MKLVACHFTAVLLSLFVKLHLISGNCGKQENESCGDLVSGCCDDGLTCDVVTNKCKANRRRGLRTFMKELQEDKLWQEQKAECGMEIYSLSLHSVEGHISFLAVPSIDGLERGCRPMTMSDISNEVDNHGKQATVLTKDIPGEELLDQFMSNGYEMGEYSLLELSLAFDMADSLKGKKYDLIHSNCGVFAVSMAQQLQYEITEDVIDYLVDRLTATDLAEQMHSSRNLGALVQFIDVNNQKSLVRAVVQAFIDNQSK